MKTCRKCGATKSLNGFYPRARSRDGKRATCNACMNAYQREWVAKTGKGKERSARYRAAHPELERQRQEKYNVKRRQDRGLHVEEQRARDRQQYAKNAEKKAQAAQARRDKDRPAYNSQVRSRRMKDPSKHKAAHHNYRIRKLSAGGHLTGQQISEKIEFQLGRCFYCKCVLSKYHVDHFVSLANGGSNAIDNIVIACPNCNLKKNKKNGKEFIERTKNARSHGDPQQALGF